LNERKKYLIYAIIAGFIISGFWHMLSNFDNVPNLPNYIIDAPVDSGLTLQDGEYGNTYTDLTAGFTVTKPNEKWHFIKDVMKYREEELGLQTTPLITGSVILQKPHIATITIAAQSEGLMPDGQNFTVSRWHDYGFDYLNNTLGMEFEILDQYISPENDYGYLETIGRNSEFERYDYETIRVYNNDIFLFHIISGIPEKLSSEDLQEIDNIFNSYEIIP